MTVRQTTAGSRGDKTPDAKDVAYWTNHIVPCLKSLMDSTEAYTPKEHEAQLRILHEHVIPNLGPRPSQAYDRSYITQSGSPIQMSVNASTKGDNCVRYCWEMLGPEGGSSSDPLAIQATKDITASVCKTFGFSTRWSDALISALEVTPKEAQEVVEQLPQWLRSRVPEGVEAAMLKRIPFSFTAFDLKGSSIGMKLYINLKAKELVGGKTATPVVWDMLRGFQPAFRPEPLKLIQDYVDQLPGSSVELVGIDCLPEAELSNARVKLYINTLSNSFNTVRDVVTLGGRIGQDDETKKGLKILHDIWHLMLQEPEGLADDDYVKDVIDSTLLFQKTYFSFELRPNRDLPQVKVYLPTWNYVRSDAETVKNYEENFRIVGHPWGQDGKYGKILTDAFGTLEHGRKKPIHCDASYIFSEKKGVYQTLYYSTPLAAEE